MVRLLLSFAFAVVAYELFWHLLSRCHGVNPRWFGRSRAEQRLREGISGVLRLVVAWALVLTIYTFGTESTLLPFTREWWLGAVGSDEWTFIAAMAPVLAVAEWCFLRSTASDPPKPRGTAEGLSLLPAPLRNAS